MLSAPASLSQHAAAFKGPCLLDLGLYQSSASPIGRLFDVTSPAPKFWNEKDMENSSNTQT